MSVLAIDIGNTRVGVGVFTQGKSKDPAQRITHAELDAQLPGLLKAQWEKVLAETKDADDEIAGAVVASVVPALTDTVVAAVKRHLSVDAAVIRRDLAIPLKTALTNDTTVGTDRLLGALASYVNTERACVIVSAGSALVVDCIDDEGVFRGGAIAPGLAMGARALHQFSAQLPEASLTPPPEPFGRDTQEALNTGLIVGARGAIKELIERYATALGTWPHVVATGGDARLLLGESELVDSLIPDLVLQGAALVWEHHRMKA